MYIVLMWLDVNAQDADAFLVATLEMGHAALKEKGTRRFEVLRDDNVPTHFVVYKATKTRADHEAHLTTAHAIRWLTQVTPMLAGPMRQSFFNQLF